jgi:hypothetical protein
VGLRDKSAQNAMLSRAELGEVRSQRCSRVVTPAGLRTAELSGRYWARTSDPQLVELVLSQLS